MHRLDLKEIAEVIEAQVAADTGGLTTSGYSIDSRTLRAGDLFFALKGESGDGHDHVRDAWEKSAVGAVVERPIDGIPSGFPQMVVRSPLSALQRIASHVRSRTDLPVVAVTGSNGKTTTKEMIAVLLSTRMKVRRSPGNFNNHIGLPLSLLALEHTDEALVVELGSNHPGEIAALCRIAQPQVGVITNVGRAHLGMFGSIDAVAREKSDLARCLQPGGEAVVNADDAALMAQIESIDVGKTTFGLTSGVDFRATSVDVSRSSGSSFALGGLPISLKAPGIHSVYNALGAIATAGVFGISVKDAAEAIHLYEPLRMKMQTYGGLTLIDDTYNSNPDSAQAALSVLSSARGGRRVFVMGDMLELGQAAEQLHREVGSLVARSPIDLLVTIGELAGWASEEAKARGMDERAVVHFADKAQARRDLRGIVKPDDVVLVKGSRLAGLDEIVEFLKSSAIVGSV
jgi:UDP-N-acetylmuramoyl-tripeptide--D-alanyl-D-alanine ligase